MDLIQFRGKLVSNGYVILRPQRDLVTYTKFIYTPTENCSFFLLPNTRLVQQSFEASRKQQAGCINQTCVALTPLPSSIPGIQTHNLSIVSRLCFQLDHSFCLYLFFFLLVIKSRGFWSVVFLFSSPNYAFGDGNF